MLQRLTKMAVVVALCCTIGLHWAFLQSLAWVGMVVRYSQHATLGEALEKTFDGKHPCALCKQIAKDKGSEKKSDLQTEGKKLEFSFVLAAFVFCRPTHFWRVSLAEKAAELLTHSPPVPPPRSAFA